MVSQCITVVSSKYSHAALTGHSRCIVGRHYRLGSMGTLLAQHLEILDNLGEVVLERGVANAHDVQVALGVAQDGINESVHRRVGGVPLGVSCRTTRLAYLQLVKTIEHRANERAHIGVRAVKRLEVQRLKLG